MKKAAYILTTLVFLAALLLPCLPGNASAASCGMCDSKGKMTAGMDCNSSGQGISCSCCSAHSSPILQASTADVLRTKSDLCVKFISKFFSQTLAKYGQMSHVRLLASQSPPRSAQSSLPLYQQFSVLRL